MNPPLAPQQRLALTRERLRLALQTPPAPSGGARASGSGTHVVLDALRLWWQQYPLRAVGERAADLIRSVVAPVAQAHPLGLVLGALAVGGLLVLVKPWRWISLPAMVASVLPQILPKILAEMPTSTWLDGLDALLRSGYKPKE